MELAKLPDPARRWIHLFGLSSLTGFVAGLATAVMEWGLEEGVDLLVGRVAPHASAEVFQFHPIILVLPAIGGLASGLIVLALCPHFTSHGTDAMIRAFHRHRGNLELRGPMVKAAASVVVISCGGSAGPEGPVAALGAAIGSTLGKLFNVSPSQRRTLLIAGCAAGIGAIFRCPLGGALFAVSVLYRDPDYETDAIVPSLAASVVGYSTFVGLWGHGEFLLQGTERLVFSSPLELLPFLVLGPLCGLAAIFFGMSFQFVHWLVKTHNRLPIWLTPAIGGLATGGLACFLPQVMDARYEFIQATMDRSVFSGGATNWWWWAGLFGVLVLMKCLATASTVGSGGAGGALGPSLAIGGITGAFLGAVCEALFPGALPEPLRQALIPVGMGGVLAASMRVPLAAIVMSVEMTGSYGLIVPVMLVCVASYVIGHRWGLNSEQVPSSIDSPVHATDVVVRLLESTQVAELAERQWQWIVSPDAHLDQIAQRLEPGQRPSFMVVENDRLLGMITLPDLERVLSDPQLARVVIALDIMNEHFAALTADRDLYHALEMFRHEKHAVLPVVSRETPHRFLGVVTRRAIFDAMMNRVSGLKEFAMGEHQGLAAIDEEARLDHLLMAVGGGSGPQVRRLMVPLEVIGTSIRESQFRTRYGVQIVAVEQSDGTLQCPPDPDVTLDGTQRLLVIASEDKIGRPRPTG